MPKEREEYYYNGFGLPDSTITTFYRTSWEKYSKDYYQYDENQRKSLGIRYKYDQKLDDFKEDIRIENYYTDTDLRDSVRFYTFYEKWNFAGTHNYFYEFDDNGRLLNERLRVEGSEHDYSRVYYEYYEPTDVTENISEQGLLSVSPNPATDYFNISINGFAGKKAHVNIYDIYGNCVFSEEISITSESFFVPIVTNSYSTGYYTVSILIDGYSYNNSVLIIK